MGIIAVILPFIFGLISFIKYKKIINLQVIFNLLWFFVVLISLLNILDNIPIRKEIYLMSSIFTLVFNIGGFMANLVKKPKFITRREIDYFFIKLCILIVAFFYIILFIRALRYLSAGGNFSGIRYNYYYGNDIIKNVWENLLITYIVDGVFKFLTLYLLYNILHKGSLKVSIIIICLMFLNLIFTGGRLVILQLVLLLIIQFLKFRKMLNKKTRKIIAYVVFFGLVAIVFISLKRNITGLIKQGISYFCTSMAFSSAILNNYNIELIGFGRIVFAPILDLLINFLRYFHATDQVSSAILVSDITKNALVVGLDGGTYNALVPAFFHLYMGGGYISIIVFGFLFGFICIIVEKRKSYFDFKNELLWMYLLIGVLFSSMGWQFMSVSNLTTLLCIYLSQKKIRNYSREEKVTVV